MSSLCVHVGDAKSQDAGAFAEVATAKTAEDLASIRSKWSSQSLRALLMVLSAADLTNPQVFPPTELAHWIQVLTDDASVAVQVLGESDAAATILSNAMLLSGLVLASERRLADQSRVWTAKRAQVSQGVKLATTTTNNATLGDDDMIDEDALLDETNLLAPPPAMGERTAGDDCDGREPCENCTCGRAEEKPRADHDHDHDHAHGENAPSSSCGKCHLGDAFRCASCPYLGKPAFKPGDEVLRNEPPTFSNFAVRSALQEYMRPTNLTPLLQQQAQKQSYTIVERRLFQLLGEANAEAAWSEEFCQEVLGNHSPTTVRELTLRMQSQLDRTIQIGTTSDATSLYRMSWKRQERIKLGASAYWKMQSQEDPTIETQLPSDVSSKNQSAASRDPFESASLIVHSPNHAEGKTCLVRATAQYHLGCSLVHVVSGGPLLAKYGIHADTALESMIHGWLLHAAMQAEPICIIIDKLETLLPAQLSNTSSAGDAAVPVWNAIASYLKAITSRMDRVRGFPFPTKNKLYHPTGSGGQILGVRVCLVGIVTCPDDGWRSSVGTATILDAMVGARYRLPSLTGPTRHAAFSHAFSRAKLELDDEAQRALIVLATTAAWAKGGAFQSVANMLSQELGTTQETTVSLQRLESAFARVKAQTAPFAEVQFQHSQGIKSDVFASVGGNEKAKQSLEDAMALDPRKRRMLARFGFSPPAGILLYGPPGCGKTILAKALASLLRAPKNHSAGSAVLGGTFISLGSSDLVQAEVGTSEKMLVSAFDFAEKNSPSVIFLDEFQALFTERSRGGSGRLASTLLQCMDKIQQWSKVQQHAKLNSESSEDAGGTANRVVVLGATNTPWMVDSAFLRTGRFDRVVHVGLPTASERASIIKVHASKMRLEEDQAENSLLNELCLEIAEATHGFSGADLAALCRAAAVRALSEDGTGCVVSKRHFLTALHNDVHASSDDDLVKRLDNWRP
eukprot:Nitzschia sp. Nitz4//scaffold162_size51285//45975//49854//NITZ4_006978-RA/size51285-processed-gene-0.47-mRNA-1//-1//CDS//3329538000//7345//frame0